MTCSINFMMLKSCQGQALDQAIMSQFKVYPKRDMPNKTSKDPKQIT